jgi:hypothetical protein
VPGSGTQAFCELPDAQQTGKVFGVGRGCYLLAQGLLRNCGMEISDREYSINARNCLLLPTCVPFCATDSHLQPPGDANLFFFLLVQLRKNSSRG